MIGCWWQTVCPFYKPQDIVKDKLKRNSLVSITLTISTFAWLKTKRIIFCRNQKRKSLFQHLLCLSIKLSTGFVFGETKKIWHIGKLFAILAIWYCKKYTFYNVFNCNWYTTTATITTLTKFCSNVHLESKVLIASFRVIVDSLQVTCDR